MTTADARRLLTRTPWSSLAGAFGPDPRVPRALARLLDPDVPVPAARKALRRLEPAWHQGTVYEVTPAVTRFLAALLTGRARRGTGAADGVDALLLGCLAFQARDHDDARVALVEEWSGEGYLSRAPDVVALLALRPALHRAAAPFLDDPAAEVRVHALTVALAAAEHPDLAPHRPALAARARLLLPPPAPEPAAEPATWWVEFRAGADTPPF
ncbi:hypothetical protein ACFV6F_22485 [Kitasatospora phosalacinea]|uniref:hypothetical protein n=1 Tax=Kitasatospora phosalacinea TaxID=2065 RepID=UPI00365F0E53